MLSGRVCAFSSLELLPLNLRHSSISFLSFPKALVIESVAMLVTLCWHPLLERMISKSLASSSSQKIPSQLTPWSQIWQKQHTWYVSYYSWSCLKQVRKCRFSRLSIHGWLDHTFGGCELISGSQTWLYFTERHTVSLISWSNVYCGFSQAIILPLGIDIPFGWHCIGTQAGCNQWVREPLIFPPSLQS